jgi:hypothetical protein
MSIVIGTIALFVALVALWFSAESMKRGSSQNEALIKVHVKPISQSLRETNKAIGDLAKRLGVMETEVKVLSVKRTSAKDALADLETRTEAKERGAA